MKKLEGLFSVFLVAALVLPSVSFGAWTGPASPFSILSPDPELPISESASPQAKPAYISLPQIRLEDVGFAAAKLNSLSLNLGNGISWGSNFLLNVNSLGFFNFLGEGIKLPSKTTNPSSPVAGTIYYDSTAKEVKLWDGSAWKSVGSGSGAAAPANPLLLKYGTGTNQLWSITSAADGSKGSKLSFSNPDGGDLVYINYNDNSGKGNLVLNPGTKLCFNGAASGADCKDAWPVVSANQGSTFTTPVTIDLSAKTSSAGRDSLILNSSADNDFSAIITNMPKVGIYSTSKKNWSDLLIDNIEAGGSVGVGGKADPKYKFDVKSGYINLGDAGSEVMIPGGATLDGGLLIRSEGLVVSGGNVSIGTDKPKAALHVSGATNQLYLDSDPGNSLDGSGGGLNQSEPIIFHVGGAQLIARNADFDGANWKRAKFGTVSAITFGGGDERNNLLPGDMRFLTAPYGDAGSNIESFKSVLTIKNNGDIGIGTDSPSKKLDINGGGLSIKSGSIYFESPEFSKAPVLGSITTLPTGSLPPGTYFYAITYGAEDGGGETQTSGFTNAGAAISSGSGTAVFNISEPSDSRVGSFYIYRSNSGNIPESYKRIGIWNLPKKVGEKTTIGSGVLEKTSSGYTFTDSGLPPGSASLPPYPTFSAGFFLKSEKETSYNPMFNFIRQSGSNRSFVGINTDRPSQMLEILGVGSVSSASANNVLADSSDGLAARLRITDTNNNPELQLQYGVNSGDHWGLYVEKDTKRLRFWNNADVAEFSNSGSYLGGLVVRSVRVGVVEGRDDTNVIDYKGRIESRLLAGDLSLVKEGSTVLDIRNAKFDQNRRGFLQVRINSNLSDPVSGNIKYEYRAGWAGNGYPLFWTNWYPVESSKYMYFHAEKDKSIDLIGGTLADYPSYSECQYGLFASVSPKSDYLGTIDAKLIAGRNCGSSNNSAYSSSSYSYFKELK